MCRQYSAETEAALRKVADRDVFYFPKDFTAGELDALDRLMHEPSLPLLARRAIRFCLERQLQTGDGIARFIQQKDIA